MREAFPSLPFGSPAVDKECRDKDCSIPSSAVPEHTSSEATAKEDPRPHYDRDGHQSTGYIEGKHSI